MKTVKQLSVVVASPGDVAAERKALGDVMSELNKGVAADRGIRLELLRWETDAYPGFHVDGPQGLIDPMLRITTCDLVIGIFWKRFGTPTAGVDSGTEYELKTAFAEWLRSGAPQILIYFNQKPAAPASSVEADNWSRVLRFRELFPKEGLWWSYKGSVQFEKLVRSHITLYIREQFPLTDAESDSTGAWGSSDRPQDVAARTDESPIGVIQSLRRQSKAHQPTWSQGEMEPALKLKYAMTVIEKSNLADAEKEKIKHDAMERFMDEVWAKP